ncbi:MAG: hypothetical protein ACLPKB_10170 [Xanthobacteraceae bacterium]
MDALDRGHAIGSDGQLRRGLGIRRCPALQRKQAYDHLQAVQQSVIGLLARNLLLPNQRILLTKQSLVPSKSLAQPDFGQPSCCQLAFVARVGTPFRAFKYGIRRKFRARQLFNGHVVSLYPALSEIHA